MAPLKRIAKVSESSNKRIKLLGSNNLPEDLVVCISSFLPIQSLLQNRVVSKKFRHTEIKSLDLDFSGVFSVRRRKLKVVKIVENIFNQHEGSEINRFVLILNPIGVEDMIISWINTCIGKNIQELDLDFSKSKKVMDIPINFSAIETLTVLKLKWCKFEVPDSPKGLRHLKTLSLKRTKVTKEIIDAIFSNCIHLELLELIECRMFGILSIYAQNHEKFKSLVVSSMPKILHILLSAPTLEIFKYDGYVRKVIFLRPYAFKEADLDYKRHWRNYDSSDLVVANTKDCIKEVHILKTTNVFLEALTYKCVEGKLIKPTFTFKNLLKFRIVFKAPTFCTLLDIAGFLKECPKLEQVLIDITNFTFGPNMFWEIHHKQQIQNDNYRLECLNEVKIIGYKGHWHELDIVQFFVENAPSLMKLELEMLKNAESEAHAPDYARIRLIKSKFPGVVVTEV